MPTNSNEYMNFVIQYASTDNYKKSTKIFVLKNKMLSTKTFPLHFVLIFTFR